MNKKLQKYDLQAAELFRSSNEAILSTVSKKFDGFPFGSYITYVTGRNRCIYLYASDIAEHTKNLKSCIWEYVLLSGKNFWNLC